MTERLPTVGGDSGTWGTVLNGFLGVGHNADGSGIYEQSGGAVRWVAGTGITGVSGSDSNNGLSPTAAMATIQAAYDSLPAAGGTLVLSLGTHSVGTGFTGSHIKPAVFTSVAGSAPGAGHFPSYTTQGTSPAQMPTITGTGTILVNIAADTANVGRGWAFKGICFDMRSASNITGIHANGLNFLRVQDCQAEGNGASNDYLIRSNYTSATDSDASWYRIENNNCRSVNLCSLADGETDGNCNNSQVFNNVVFNSAGSQIKMTQAQRCAIWGNNLEGGGIAVELAGVSRYNYIFWNGGEETFNPFVKFGTSCISNIFFNFGSTTDTVNTTDLTGQNYQTGMAGFVPVWEQTADFTLQTIYGVGGTLKMNKATAITVTLPTNASVPWGVGKWIDVFQYGAGQVTVSGAGGTTVRAPLGAKTSARYAIIRATKVDTDEWVISGNATV